MSYDESDNIEYADYRINIIQYLNILLKYIYGSLHYIHYSSCGKIYRVIKL